jgi:DNA-binding LacI/PurR family transcriptional regulator
MTDIARRAGVSQALVSLTLNGRDSGRISPEKRRAILRAAREAGYYPNMSAAQLRGKASKLIGVAGNFLTVPVFSAYLWRLGRALSQAGYSSIVSNTRTYSAGIRHPFPDLLGRGVDAVVVSDPSVRESDLAKLKIPVLKVFSDIKNFDLSADIYGGALGLVRHLLTEHGHRKVGLAAMRTVCPLRARALDDALREAGSGPASPWTVSLKTDPDPEKKIMRLIKKEKVTAFMCVNDLIAAKLIKFLVSSGLRVPEDIAVTGFDGSASAAFLTPSLTTAVIPSFRLADETVRILTGMIAAGQLRYPGGEPLLLKPELRFAESCGCRPVRSSERFFDGFHALPSLEADAQWGTMGF